MYRLYSPRPQHELDVLRVARAHVARGGLDQLERAVARVVAEAAQRSVVP